jgi:hypothetical protein
MTSTARSPEPVTGQQSDLRVTRPPEPGARPTRRLPSSADSIWWLALVAAAFTCAQLAFVVPHLGLSWDEVVYISQIGRHAPAANLDPPRARGVSLIAAPVTMLTSSILALRIYLAAVSGLGLFLALLAWRSLRPTWILALAGACYGSLWTAQYYGPQAMPDGWVAFSVLAAVGLFLRAAGRRADPAAGRGALAGLSACIAVAALVRPGDALFVAVALVVAVLAVPRWRQPSLLAAVALGFLAGAAEWVIEAYVRYGGALARLHAAASEQGGFALHPGLGDELKALNGPTLCRPCVVSLRYPEISGWWLALPLFVALGLLAARRAGRLDSSLLAAACGFGAAFQYLFLINYAAPRFLLPAYALLAIPVADALAFVLTGGVTAAPGTSVGGPGRTGAAGQAGLRPAAVMLVSAVLLAQLAVQHVVLTHQVQEKLGYFGAFPRIAAELHRLGVRPPCLIKGKQDVPIAYYTGCASAPKIATVLRAHPTEPVVLLVRSGEAPPRAASGWKRHTLPGGHTSLLGVTAYLSGGSSQR